MKGYIDRIEGNRIIGWCAPVTPGSPVIIAAKEKSSEVATSRADIERKDVEEAGICSAKCGFELIIPSRAFDQYGPEFLITLLRVEDGAVLAESISINNCSDTWVWSATDLAMITKAWHEEKSQAGRGVIRRRMAKFDLSGIIAALIKHGFFEEVEAALTAGLDPESTDESWLALRSESCSDIQIKRWAFECRLKAAGARARFALLEAEYLDGSVMPVFREAFADNVVSPSDWVALLDLFALCPDAASLADFFQSLIEFFTANHSDAAPVVDACLRHGQIESVEGAARGGDLRLSCGETYSAICCYALYCSFQPSVAKDFNLDLIFRSLRETTELLPNQIHRTVDNFQPSDDPLVWPSCDGVHWPRFRISRANDPISFCLFLVVGADALPEACHESVLSLLNQAEQGLRLIIIGNTDQLFVKTREKLDQSEGVEVNYFSGDWECGDLLRKAAGKVSGDFVGWLEVGEIVSPGALNSIFPCIKKDLENLNSMAVVFDTAFSTGTKIRNHCSAKHLGELSTDRLSRLEEDWLEHQFLSDGWILVAPDLFAESLSQLPALKGPDALQYALCFAAVSHREPIRHIGKTGLFRPLPLQPVEPLHSREIIQQAELRKHVVRESPTSLEAEKRLRSLLCKHFKSEVPRITIMSSRLGKIFSPDTAREICEHFATLGYRAELVEEINPDQITPGQLILILVHQYGAEGNLIPLLAERFPDCPLIGWFWDNHHQVLGNVELARHFHACIAAHDFCRDVLASSRNVLLPSVPLCVTQWTAAEAKALFAKYGHGERSTSLYGGFVRYATAARRNEFVTALQKHIDPHALSLVDEFNLAAYFALPAEERFADWCRYRSSLCLPLFHDLSQRFFDALLCGQIPIVTDDIADMSQVVREYPALKGRFEILPGYDIDGVNRILKDVNQYRVSGPKTSSIEQHNCALSHHMLRNRLESILLLLKDSVASSSPPPSHEL